MPNEIWWVAVYGDMGIEVSFFSNQEAYETAMSNAEDQLVRGAIDTYTGDELRPQEINSEQQRICMED